jgi:hypothetical protein
MEAFLPVGLAGCVEAGGWVSEISSAQLQSKLHVMSVSCGATARSGRYLGLIVFCDCEFTCDFVRDDVIVQIQLATL